MPTSIRPARRQKRVYSHPVFTGEANTIYQFGANISGNGLAEQIANGTFLMDESGDHFVRLVPFGERFFRLENSIGFMSTPVMARYQYGRPVVTCILSVTDISVTVWGLPVGKSLVGLYEYTLGGIAPRPLEIQGVKDQAWCITSATQHRFTQHTSSGCALCPSHDYYIRRMTDGAYLCLERIGDGGVYQYIIDEKSGMRDWYRVPLESGEDPVAIVRVREVYVLVTHDREKQLSFMRVLRNGSLRGIPLEEVWDGRIEYIWTSPNELSLLWVVRPSAESSERQIYLNGRMIHHGEFVVESGSSAVWSESGFTCGVRVTAYSRPGSEYQLLVTPTEQVAVVSGRFVREFLVDNAGLVVATIEDDAGVCTVRIRGRTFNANALSFNLRWVEGGAVGFHSLVDRTLLRRVDRTNVSELSS